jgi:hypothetical protein
MFFKIDIDELDEEAENFYIKFQIIHRDQYLAQRSKQLEDENLETFK